MEWGDFQWPHWIPAHPRVWLSTAIKKNLTMVGLPQSCTAIVPIYYIYTHVCIYIYTHTLQYSTVQYSTAQHITLHYITLHYITLHYIHTWWGLNTYRSICTLVMGWMWYGHPSHFGNPYIYMIYVYVYVYIYIHSVYIYIYWTSIEHPKTQ